MPTRRRRQPSKNTGRMVGTLAQVGNLAIRKSKTRLSKTTPKDLLPWGVPHVAAHATMPFVHNARTRWGEGSLLQPIVSQEREQPQGARQNNDRNRKQCHRESRSSTMVDLSLCGLLSARSNHTTVITTMKLVIEFMLFSTGCCGK